MLTPNHSHTSQRGARVGQMRPALLFALPSTLFVLTLFAWLLWGGPDVSAQNLEPSSPFDLNRVTPPSAAPVARSGRLLYQENCAPCHGEGGMGDGPAAVELPSPPTAFADPEAIWELSPAELFHTAKYGRIEKMMPPWQNQMSDDEIWRAVAYAWSFHTSAAEVQAGQDLYDLSCAECHGPQGAGDGPQATVDMNDFGDLTAAMARSQADWLANWQAAHNEIGGEWDRGLQRQALEYIRTFTYVPAWESSYRPGSGVVNGVVKQGTADVALSAGLTVTLDAYVDFEPVANFTAAVDAGGAFTFTDLAVGEDIVYLATVAMEEIRYSSPIVRLTETEPQTTTDIVVYATTAEPPGLRVDRAHWIVDSQPGGLVVGQILAFGMEGDRTFVGSQVDGVDLPVTVGLMIPPGAEQVTFENGAVGDRFRQVGDVYYDTTPMIPGEGTKQIVVRYALPYADTSLDVTQSFLYPVTLLNLLIADLPNLQVEVTGLESAGSQDFQGRTYRIWSAENLAAGDVQLALTGLLAADAVDPREMGAATDAQGAPLAVASFAPWMAWVSGALVVVMLAGVVGWAWRNGRIQTATRGEDLKRQRQELLQEIARLDDRHELGEVSGQEWARQRAQLKARVLMLANR